MTRAQLVLRATVLITPALALVAVPGRTPLWQLLLAVLLGCVAWRTPDSLIGLAVLTLVGWRWVAVADGGLPAVALLSVGCLVAFEVASVLAAYGPPELELQPALVRLWLGRAVIMLAPAVVVLCAGRAVIGTEGSAALWFVGVATAALCFVALRTWLHLGDAASQARP